MAQRLRAREAERGRRLPLDGGDRVEAGTQGFGHVGAAQEDQADDRAGLAAPLDSHARQAEVDEEKLHEQRRIARQFDVGGADLRGDRNPVVPDRGHQEAEGEGADDADGRDPQGEDGGVDVEGRVSRQDLKIHKRNPGRGRGRAGRSPAAGEPVRGPRPRTCVSWWRWCPRRLRRPGRRGSRRHRRRGRGSARSPCGRSLPRRARRARCSASRGGRCCPS